MKLNYMFVLLTLIAVIIFMPSQQIKAQAGDTLVVEWVDDQGGFILDALRTAIENDSNRPEGRVYKLRKGGYYWVTETITNNGWHLRIVGEDPDPNDPEGHPAIIQRVARNDGSVTDRLFTGAGSITFKNIYFIGCDDAGSQTAYQPIQIDASDSRFVIDHCIFERTNFALIAWTAKNNDIFLTNNIYRNLVENPGSQQWSGRGISIWADQDTVVVENNTFFNVGFTAFQFESGAASYMRFNHNTMVNIGRNFIACPWPREAYFANNLVVNGFWHGEGSADVTSPGRDSRSIQAGMFQFGALPSKYGPEEGRRILFSNTAAWSDPAFAVFYADTIRPQPFIGQVEKLDFFDPYEQIVASDTIWLTERPDFPTYPSEIIPDMITYIDQIRAGRTDLPAYFWQIPIDEGTGQPCYTCPSWPAGTPRGVPENFNYTTASILTAGSDGLPLGDLNWFTAQKAQFEANKDQYIAQLEAKAGTKYIYPVMGQAEAEGGSLSGTAVVEDYNGPLPYFDMDAGGYVEWKFNMAEAATVDLIVTTRSQDAVRGEFIRINGINIRNDSGFGEYYWSDLTNDWKSYTITASGLIEGAEALNLPAGENTIRIEKSWGYQEFLSVEVVAGGSIVATLNATNYTTIDIINVISSGGTFPSGFKSVNMGANGSITFSFNAPENGEYALSVYYWAPNGTETGQLTMGNQNVAVTFEGEAGDSSVRSILTDAVALTSGNQAITISAGNINIDWIQYVQKVTLTSVRERSDLPKGFALSQNYPNPFNPMTNINFDIGKASNVKLTIYNFLGQKVATLVDAFMNEGTYTVSFNGSNLASGVYFYRLEAGDMKFINKMMLLK